MVLPSSTEEGKLLKKRYAVFNHDGSLAELKGFELKRRGELEVIKVFQSQVFEKFLRGDTLAQCYDAVGEVANQWLDVLYSKGGDVDDDELMELISQNKTMSQTLEDYGTAKGTSQTTARRLADFLGAEMVKDKGLNCRMILSNRPHGAPVTDRAVPTAIFSAEPAVKKHYLRKWLKDPAMENFDIRAILDWDYYLDRLGNCIRKIITIPAAMQKCSRWSVLLSFTPFPPPQNTTPSHLENPRPRRTHPPRPVKHPDWLRKIVREINDGYRQTKIDQLFKAAPPGTPQQLTNAGASTNAKPTPAAAATDIEDMAGGGGGGGAAGRSILGARARVTKRISNGAAAAGGALAPDGGPGKENADVGGGGQEEEEEEVVPIRREDDFQGWLAQQKAGWKKRREQNKLKRRTEARSQAMAAFRGSGSSGARGGTAGLGAAGAAEKRRRTAAMGKSGLQGYLTSAQDALLRGFWQVVEVRPSDNPGSFTVFAMTGPGELQVIPITIPRVFYVNCLEDKGPAGSSTMGRRVARTLPNGRASPFLYEVAMDEAKFQRNEKQVEDFLHHAGIEGVYELGTPLVYRAMLHLGSVARVVQGRAKALKGVKSGSGQAPGFELEDLELVTAAAHPYLHPSVATFKHIYLYHSSSGKRGMVGLFYVQGTNEDIEPEPTVEGGAEDGGGEGGLGPGERPVIAKAVVWLVNPFSRRDGEQRPPFARIFEKFTNNPDSSCTFKTSSVSSPDEAWAAADSSLASYSRQRNGPTLVLSQGLVQGQELRRRLPALSELPVTHIPGNAEDERYPALGWQAFAAQRMVQRYKRKC
ncbi:unnamed protein product [Ectocarpus fasciculatus]